MGFKTASLSDMIKLLGESEVKKLLSSFSCPRSLDVEEFLKKKAIVFSDQSLCKTHLVFTSYKGELVLIGYFTLSIKYIKVKKGVLSSRLETRLKKFANYDKDLKEFTIPALLIGQLGKNFTNGYNRLITGDELLKIATDKIEKIQQEAGSKVAYLECEDKIRLTEFYSRNGFVKFGKRKLDRDETSSLFGEELLQYLRYF